jgi:carboxyl-terminal processing protease
VIGTTARFGHFPPISVRLEDRLLAEGRVGYIGFNVFMPVIAARFADALSAQREAGIEALIIDLRGNPGGLAGMVMGLSGWIVGDRAAALGVMKMRQAELRFIVNPRARNDRFHGPVAILVDGLSASTSELFAAGLQELGRAVVVGETSAGMSLPSVIEALPDGDLLQLVTADLHTPGGARIEGVGVTPDVVVSLDTESLLAGGDAQIAAAVAHLLHSSEPAPASPPETP